MSDKNVGEKGTPQAREQDRARPNRQVFKIKHLPYTGRPSRQLSEQCAADRAGF